MPITIDNTGQTVTLNPPYTPATPDDSIQRITQVYFAKKTITQNGTNISFIKIDSAHIQQDTTVTPNIDLPYDAEIGKTVYLIIETVNMRTLSIDAVIRPGNNNLTGNTDTLSLMKFNPVTQTYESTRLFTAVVGNHDMLQNNTRTNPYTNLADHNDKVIIKLQIRPSLLLEFNNWSRSIAANNNIANLEVVVERTDNLQCAYGPNSTTEVNEAGVFLNTDAIGKFRIANRNFYCIYHGSNLFNTFAEIGPANARRRRRVGKVNNSNSTEIVFFYYDQFNNEHRICSRTKSVVNRKNRVNVVPAEANRGTLLRTISYAANRAAGENIDAIQLLVYTNGTLGDGAGNTDKWYPNIQGTVELIDMDILQNAGVGSQIFEAFNYNQNNVQIRYGFQHTRRRSIQPDLFAGFIGAIAQFRQEGSTHYIVSQGFSYSDASCFPSAEHVNGEAGDLNLLTTALDGENTTLAAANFDYLNEVKLRNLLYNFGFESARSENFSNTANNTTADNHQTILPHTQHTTTPRHNNHLHVHGFNAVPNIY